jgi:hypothetical protein
MTSLVTGATSIECVCVCVCVCLSFCLYPQNSPLIIGIEAVVENEETVK